MNKTSFKRVSVLLFVLWAATACTAGFQSGTGSSSESSASILSLSPEGNTIAAGATQQFIASGGKAPYTYAIDYPAGAGTIDNKGLYRAPTMTGSSSLNVSILVTDGWGETAYATLIVGPSANYSITATYAPATPSVGQAVTITPVTTQTGTTHTYAIASGTGTLSGNVYTTNSTTPETATITVTDSNGAQTTVSITSTLLTVMSAMSVSPFGIHQVGGLPCASNRVSLGTVVDAGLTISGDQTFCGEYQPRASLTQWIMDIHITPYAAHAAPPACPSGFVEVGTIGDCGGGMCYGQQSVCVQYGSSTSTYSVKEFYITPSGAHAAGVNCNAGFISRGQTADCGGGTCSGYQNFCARY